MGRRIISNMMKNLQQIAICSCESCEKSFSGAGSLKTHIHTIHEGHKDHKCESCGKSYSQAKFEEAHPYNS